jgi:hypothetical protein
VAGAFIRNALPHQVTEGKRSSHEEAGLVDKWRPGQCRWSSGPSPIPTDVGSRFLGAIRSFLRVRPQDPQSARSSDSLRQTRGTRTVQAKPVPCVLTRFSVTGTFFQSHNPSGCNWRICGRYRGSLGFLIPRGLPGMRLECFAKCSSSSRTTRKHSSISGSALLHRMPVGRQMVRGHRVRHRHLRRHTSRGRLAAAMKSAA